MREVKGQRERKTEWMRVQQGKKVFGGKTFQSPEESHLKGRQAPRLEK